MLKFILSLLLILNLSCKSSSVGTPTEKSNPGGEQANAGNDGADGVNAGEGGADPGDNEANAGEDGADVTLISNANELIGIKDDLTGSYQLSANINLDGVNWVPIGTSENPFQGKLNGGGFKISNLNYAGAGIGHVGLFGVTGNKSLIYNLTLENFVINNSIPLNECGYDADPDNHKVL